MAVGFKLPFDPRRLPLNFGVGGGGGEDQSGFKCRDVCSLLTNDDQDRESKHTEAPILINTLSSFSMQVAYSMC